MSEVTAKSGHALRAYQIILILAVGWGAGRLPQLLEDSSAERTRLEAAVGGSEARATAAMPEPQGDVQTAAEVAARVAAGVAEETVARLIAAGWAPRGSEPVVIRVEQVAGRPQESVVRLAADPAPPVRLSGLDYSLPPGTTQARMALTAADPKPLPAARTSAAHATASAGYAALKSGDRREGVRLLKAAVAMQPDAPEAEAWTADIRQQTRRWSLAGYSLARGGGSGDPLAASPVLGGGQSGAALGYRINPLGDVRLSVVGRIAAAAGESGGIDGETAEAALGLRVEPFRSVPIALDVERRFALGTYSRNAWAGRISGGKYGEAKVLNRTVKLEAYGEVGLLEGFTKSPDLYGGGQAWGATPVTRLGDTDIDVGAGLWAGAQRNYGLTASRLDLGPSARFKIAPWPFSAQIDYRLQVVGNAVPGSGPVVTVAGEF